MSWFYTHPMPGTLIVRWKRATVLIQRTGGVTVRDADPYIIQAARHAALMCDPREGGGLAHARLIVHARMPGARSEYQFEEVMRP